MTSEGGLAEAAGQEWVVLASFENRHAAEHMLLSLGQGFRKNACKGGASAFVVSGDKDGSLKLTESRVLEVGYLTHMLLHLSVSWMVGFWGTLSTRAPEAKVGRGRRRSVPARGGPIRLPASPGRGRLF